MMRASFRKDLWLTLTVISITLSMLFVPLCAGSFVAARRWQREPDAAGQRSRIRLDLRVPASLLAVGSVTLAACSYRRYAKDLERQP